MCEMCNGTWLDFSRHGYYIEVIAMIGEQVWFSWQGVGGDLNIVAFMGWVLTDENENIFDALVTAGQTLLDMSFDEGLSDLPKASV